MLSQRFATLACLLAVAAAQEDEVCHPPAKVNALQGQLSDAHAEVASLKAALEKSKAGSDVVSVTAIASQMGGILSNAVEEQLKKTDLDDQVYEKLTKHFGSVSELSQTVMTQVTAVDYRGHLENLKLSEKYNTHLAPHVEKATKAGQPLMEQHVYPNWEKASAQLSPHLASVKEAASKHYKTVETEVVPKLKTHATQAFDVVSDATKKFGSPEETLNKVLAPAFDFLATAAPKQAKALPTQPLDRLLFIVVALISAYVLLRVSWIVLKIALKTTRFGAKVAFFLTKIGLLFPVRVVLRLLRLVLWFSTGFYCCGLCRRKKVATSNGATQKTNEKVKKASVEEIVALLTQAQKQKKLDAAVKQASTLCKDQKAFTAPKNLEGKVLTQDVLKGALKKMNVDSKGLL